MSTIQNANDYDKFELALQIIEFLVCCLFEIDIFAQTTLFLNFKFWVQNANF